MKLCTEPQQGGLLGRRRCAIGRRPGTHARTRDSGENFPVEKAAPAPRPATCQLDLDRTIAIRLLGEAKGPGDGK